MNKIKIVFILGTLDIGGAERQFIETIRWLDRDRFELKVLSFRDHGKLRKEVEKLQIPLTCLHFQDTKGVFHPVSYVRLYKLIRDITRYLKREKPHIVQSYLFWANIHGCIAAKIAGVPIIITGRRATMNPEHMKFRDYTKFSRQWLLNITNRWVTAIVANSQVVKQHCLQREKFVTDEKLRVIYNGIDLNRYVCKIDSTVKKKELQISEHARVVGMVASLHPRKGYRDLLKAAAIVLKTYPDTVFLVVGRDDGMKPTLVALAEELRIRSSIVFTDERGDIPELLLVFDVQVSSSYIEGLSNAILEGMAVGNPIVATEVGGNPELIVHEQTGVLVPPDDPVRLAKAIIRLLGDRALRNQLGKKARHRVATRFQIEQMIQKTEALYDNLILLCWKTKL